jgi:hypothetical protein
MFHNVLVDEPKKTYDPPLHGRKSITILCPDDVCKKIRKKQGERGEVMHGERGEECLLSMTIIISNPPLSGYNPTHLMIQNVFFV